jgi:hypothetical protein
MIEIKCSQNGYYIWKYFLGQLVNVRNTNSKDGLDVNIKY